MLENINFSIQFTVHYDDALLNKLNNERYLQYDTVICKLSSTINDLENFQERWKHLALPAWQKHLKLPTWQSHTENLFS